MKFVMGRLILAMAILHAPLLMAQSNLVQNGGFETGDFTGWTVVNTGAGQFSVESGTLTPSSGSTIPTPPSGTYASVSDQLGPGSHILYQDVFIPDDGYVLLFQLYWHNQLDEWLDNGTLSEAGGPNQHIRVDIMDPAALVDDVGAGVWMNILKPSGDDPFESGFQQYQANLSQFAGETVRIRFAEVDNQFYLNLAVDDVKVFRTVPVPVDNPIALLLLVLGVLVLAMAGMRKSYLAT